MKFNFEASKNEAPKINLDNAEGLVMSLQMEMNTHGALSVESDRARRDMIKDLQEMQKDIPSAAKQIEVVLAELHNIEPMQKAA